VKAGRLLGRDLLRAHRGEPDLVRQEQLRDREAARDDQDHHGARAGGEQHADQGHVQKPQQEDREEHPELESGVATDLYALTCHLQETL
jgi:hypothetical protein